MTNRWDALIIEKAGKHGVDPALVKAIIAVESNGNAKAVGDDGRSFGLMQVQLPTAQQMGFSGTAEELLDPVANVEYGTRYLKRQIDRYTNELPAAIAAYNSGTAFRKADGSFTNQAYVNRVLDFFRAVQVRTAAAQQRPPVRPSAPIRVQAQARANGDKVLSLETFVAPEALPWTLGGMLAIGLALLLPGDEDERSR